MGSTSDWETMQHCAQTLDTLGVAYEKRVISAHRTPQLMHEWTTGAQGRGLKIIIAAAGGAAHLAGVAAALTALPVLGVPMESASLKGLDSLLSMVQMPAGVPVATPATISRSEAPTRPWGRAGATRSRRRSSAPSPAGRS
jgi:5-(carboxyamino)imidazole ribonucleotide mutase